MNRDQRAGSGGAARRRGGQVHRHGLDARHPREPVRGGLRDPLRLAVTASGLDKGELTASDIAVVGGLGEPVEVAGVEPSPRRPRPVSTRGSRR